MIPFVAFIISVLLPLGALGFFGWLGLRFVRAREQEALRPPATAPAELQRLEDAVHALETEVEAIRERQEFVERLLERPRSSPPEAGGQP